jgi:hypothetical protein
MQTSPPHGERGSINPRLGIYGIHDDPVTSLAVWIERPITTTPGWVRYNCLWLRLHPFFGMVMSISTTSGCRRSASATASNGTGWGEVGSPRITVKIASVIVGIIAVLSLPILISVLPSISFQLHSPLGLLARHPGLFPLNRFAV